MLTLNLIPQQLKKEVRLRRLYALIKRISYILIIVSIITAIILLVAQIMLQNNFNDVIAQTTLITKNSQGYNTKVKNINYRLDYITKIQGDFTTWSSLIEDLANRVPDGISLSLISINKDEALINLSGRANLRDDLLQLKQNIEKSPIYSKVELPLQNILTKENINFEISTKLNLNELNNKN